LRMQVLHAHAWGPSPRRCYCDYAILLHVAG
jgi:hypothetical protein